MLACAYCSWVQIRWRGLPGDLMAYCHYGSPGSLGVKSKSGFSGSWLMRHMAIRSPGRQRQDHFDLTSNKHKSLECARSAGDTLAQEQWQYAIMAALAMGMFLKTKIKKLPGLRLTLAVARLYLF